MLRLALALIALALVAPAVADARKVGHVSSGTAGLAAPRAPLPVPPRLTVHVDTPCPDYPGENVSCSDTLSDQVWLAPGASRFHRQHEIGHQFDRQVLTDEPRAWLMPRLGFEPGPWDRGTGMGHTGPSEVFADAYAACALGKSVRGKRHGRFSVSRWTTSYGYYPTARTHRRVCDAITRYGHAVSATSPVG